MQKDSKTAIIFSAIAVGLLILFLSLKNNDSSKIDIGSSVVSIENGTQVINLTTKAGYSPSFIEAQAGLPTELRVTTNGTYDCSAVLVLPSLGYQTTLKPSGTQAIPLVATQAQGTLEGTCGMGMYRFEIAFL